MKNSTQFFYKAGSNEEFVPGYTPDFPYIATYAELDKFSDAYVPWHWHRMVELFYMERGCLEYTTPNGKWVFPEGSGGFINSNVLHTTRIIQTDEPNIQLLHIFDPSFVGGEQGSRMENRYVQPMISASSLEMIALYPDNSNHIPLLRSIRRAFDLSNQDWGYEFELRDALTRVWMALLNMVYTMIESDKDVGSNDQIKQMMAYIHEHYDQHISVDELAAFVHISRRTCFRMFQENLHMTPMEYIKTYRLQKACKMLKKADKSITEIAGQCGLGSSSYFGKLFREAFGCSPLEYRKNWHNRDNCGHE